MNLYGSVNVQLHTIVPSEEPFVPSEEQYVPSEEFLDLVIFWYIDWFQVFFWLHYIC